MPYSELLGVMHSKVAREWGVETTADEDIKFDSSVPDWPAFADSAEALQYLKAYYKLAILSNPSERQRRAATGASAIEEVTLPSAEPGLMGGKRTNDSASAINR